MRGVGLYTTLAAVACPLAASLPAADQSVGGSTIAPSVALSTAPHGRSVEGGERNGTSVWARQPEQVFVHSAGTDWRSYPVECSAKKFNIYIHKGYEEAIARFKKHNGQPDFQKGPGWCSQVSCSEATAVKICNDASLLPFSNPKEQKLESWKIIKDVLEEINDRCNHGEGRALQGGQLTHPDKWSVILEHGKC
ncbi:tRNA delta-isopentenylpyrophosphate transferase family protein [Purpureocillium lavendulum]|uniref:tRNA delta-isopentenylpyrophosphate transferase family protein n=1 Tax=Purpureocillium lavendulum TaxID=1247861 RepID=A0AB34FLW3_9HYPO|nr:tRNA delta-isopentenylpyrophosphate transferase family protein [Purpureocillium lavendulum]